MNQPLRPFARAMQEVFRAGVSANSYALLLMPLTNVLGNFFVIVLAGLGGWLALQGLVSCGHHRHLHQLWAELHPAVAPTGEYVQLHPGCAGRGGTGL